MNVPERLKTQWNAYVSQRVKAIKEIEEDCLNCKFELVRWIRYVRKKSKDDNKHEMWEVISEAGHVVFCSTDWMMENFDSNDLYSIRDATMSDHTKFVEIENTDAVLTYDDKDIHDLCYYNDMTGKKCYKGRSVVGKFGTKKNKNKQVCHLQSSKRVG